MATALAREMHGFLSDEKTCPREELRVAQEVYARYGYVSHAFGKSLVRAGDGAQNAAR